MSELDHERFDSVSVDIRSPMGLLYRGVVYSPQFVPDWVVEVPRGQLSLMTLTGDGGLMSPDGRVRIPAGEQCPPLYCSRALFPVDSECCEREVTLEKQFCTVIVKVEGISHLAVRICGGVDGYDAAMTPHPGVFDYCSPPFSGTFSIRVPRQIDTSLSLSLVEGDTVLHTITLGERLASCGYDWSEDSLRDVLLDIRLRDAVVNVFLSSWTPGSSFSVVM
ncbi:MAG: hypothetical protein MJY62_05370 [Bacteroidales bacterium]|nr:hypothetical protein [Bacteroidales bacterium]